MVLNISAVCFWNHLWAVTSWLSSCTQSNPPAVAEICNKSLVMPSHEQDNVRRSWRFRLQTASAARWPKTSYAVQGHKSAEWLAMPRHSVRKALALFQLKYSVPSGHWEETLPQGRKRVTPFSRIRPSAFPMSFAVKSKRGFDNNLQILILNGIYMLVHLHNYTGTPLQIFIK